MLREEPPRRRQFRCELAVHEHADVPRDHLFLFIARDGNRVVTNREFAHSGLLAGIQPDLFLALVALAREAEEHEYDAKMDDVAAVTAALTGDQADERSEHVRAGGAAPHLRAADEFLQNRDGNERAQGEADAR